jgi:hypothetical protein
MILFDPKVGPIIKGWNVAGRHGGGREINECYSETKENQGCGLLPGNQRRVTLPQRLKQPMK